MIVNLTFKSNYSVDIIEEFVLGERYYYPGGNTQGGKDGILVEIISSEGKSWLVFLLLERLALMGYRVYIVRLIQISFVLYQKERDILSHQIILKIGNK